MDDGSLNLVAYSGSACVAAWKEVPGFSVPERLPWFQSARFLSLWQGFREYTPWYFLATEGGQPVGSLCGVYFEGMRMPIRWRPSARFVAWGGPLVREGPDAPEILAALLRLVQASMPRQTVYLEFRDLDRAGCLAETFQEAGYRKIPWTGLEVPLTPGADLVDGFSPARRRQIRQAVRGGIKVQGCASEADLKAWYIMLRKHYRFSIGKPVPSYSWFRRLWQDPEATSRVFLAFDQGKVIGGMACTGHAGGRMHAWYVAGKRHYKGIPSPMALLYAAAMRTAAEEGFTGLDLMGGGPAGQASRVRQYKLGFSPKVMEQARFILVQRKGAFLLGSTILGIWGWMRGRG